MILFEGETCPIPAKKLQRLGPYHSGFQHARVAVSHKYVVIFMSNI